MILDICQIWPTAFLFNSKMHILQFSPVTKFGQKLLQHKLSEFAKQKLSQSYHDKASALGAANNLFPHLIEASTIKEPVRSSDKRTFPVAINSPKPQLYVKNLSVGISGEPARHGPLSRCLVTIRGSWFPNLQRSPEKLVGFSQRVTSRPRDLYRCGIESNAYGAARVNVLVNRGYSSMIIPAIPTAFEILVEPFHYRHVVAQFVAQFVAQSV